MALVPRLSVSLSRSARLICSKCGEGAPLVHAAPWVAFTSRTDHHGHRVSWRHKSTAVSVEVRDGPSVSISNDGNAVSIQFETQEKTSAFQAAWLWSNSPSFVHPSSMQRQVTPGAYRGSRIVQAELCSASNILIKHSQDETEVRASRYPVVVPTPPPDPGTCHPIAAFNDGTPNSRHACQEQLLLRVQWDDSSAPSYYDLEWLRYWRYDQVALQKRRERTEVTSALIRAFDTGSGDLGGVQVFDFHSVIPKEITADELDLRMPYGDEKGVYNVLRVSKSCFRFMLSTCFQDSYSLSFADNQFQAVFSTGAAIISNTPAVSEGTEASVALMGRALSGELSHGMLYGDTFHVKSTPNAHNIAYTSLPLRSHQDLSYYESMPGLQLLHCVEFGDAVEGGESTLIDCMAAAAALRELAPEHFRVLSTIPATFVKQRPGANMTYQRPHIVLKEEGLDRMESIDREIVAVNWSPPFEGPLLCPAQYMEAYYAAYRAFELMLDDSARCSESSNDIAPSNNLLLLDREEIFSGYAKNFTWKYRLKPGEIMMFNNRRMLHGRCGFSNALHDHSQAESNGLTRHLVGCYTNIDDTLNRYRTLHRYFDEDVDIPNVGNGTSLIA